MSESVVELFDVVFRGEIQPGYSIDQVKARVGAVFKLDEVKVERLFSGQTPYLKRSTDITSADKIVYAMEQAGAIAEILACDLEVEGLSMAPLGANVLPDQEVTSQPEPNPVVDPQKLASMVAEPAGSYVISPKEQPETVSLDIDTSHLSIESLNTTGDSKKS